MTHTTTDAAEARDVEPYFTLPFALHEAEGHGAAYIRDARGQSVAMLMWPAHAPDGEDAAVATLYAIGRSFAAALAPATAEAASGAGEREAIRRAYIAGCEQGWELPRDEGPTDAAERYAAGYVASLPPATDPAMGLDPVTVGRCVAMCDQLATGCRAELKDPANDARTISVLDGYIGACTTLAANIAALAAAPTIPATGEAVPGSLIEKCMKIASIEAADAVESIELGYRPAHNEGAREAAERIERRIRALAATIPATGHAATEGEGA